MDSEQRGVIAGHFCSTLDSDGDKASIKLALEPAMRVIMRHLSREVRALQSMGDLYNQWWEAQAQTLSDSIDDCETAALWDLWDLMMQEDIPLQYDGECEPDHEI